MNEGSCSSSNLSQFSKHIDQSRLQRPDRFERHVLGPFPPNASLTEEFFQQESSYQLNDLHHALPEIHPSLVHPMATDAWAAEFNQQPNIPTLLPHEQAEFEQAFSELHVQKLDWVNEFNNAPMIAPASDADFEDAFEQAKTRLQWSDEFSNDQTLQSKSDIQDNKDALREAAGAITQIIQKSGSDKMKGSNFFNLMKKIETNELTIENNHVVAVSDTVGAPAASAVDWANEFNTTVKTMNWEEEFTAEQPVPWTQEFETLDDDYQAMESVFKEYNGDPSWSTEFQRQQSLVTLRQNEEEDLEDPYLEDRYDSDDFSFTPQNPLSNEPEQRLRELIQSRNVVESILALEVLVQLNPQDSSLWYLLGTRQQENENEVMAIRALKEATRLDPQLLDAWIALSVAYTNETLYDGAYSALESWIANNEKYQQVMQRHQLSLEGSRHETVQKLLIEAARSNAGSTLDPDVQIGLGVLFNISGEYDKAVDCFEAALNVRPKDYLLWNKFGATLSNSNQTGRAIDAYYNALQLNPSYIRAMYNLAIACMQMDQYKEAAEHLLGALSIQKDSVINMTGNSVMAISVSSDSIWKTLRLIVQGYMHRFDLGNACEEKNLDIFRKEFDF